MEKIQKVEKKKRASGCFMVFAGILAVLLVATFASGYFNIFYAWGAKQKLEDVTIEAQLLENGDLRITETWVLAMDKRSTPYRNGYKSFSLGGYDSIEDLTVYDHDMDITYTLLEDVTNPESGDYPDNTCYIAENRYEFEVGWFFEPIDSGVRTFTFSYTMTNIATVYDDTAELYVGFIGRNFALPIRNLSVTLHLPAQEENPLVWLHSASNGLIEIVDPSTVTIHASKVSAQTMVECRVLFDEQSLPRSPKREAVDKLEQIKAEEKGFFDASETSRRYSAFTVVLAVCLVVLSFNLFSKARRHKVEEPDYVREVPAHLSPGTARVLYRFYDNYSDKLKANVNGDLISALVLSMVQKGWLTVEVKKAGSKNKKDTVFTPHPDGRAPISNEEMPLWEIFTALAQLHGGSFTMTQYVAYGKKEYRAVDSAMTSIDKAVKASFNAQQWVETSYFWRRPSTWIGFLLLLLCPVIATSWGEDFGVLVFALVISALILLGKSLLHRRLTPEGEQQYQNLHAFHNYLTNFTILKERAPQEVYLWQEYIIFATLFGCADEVRKSMPFPHVKITGAGATPAGGRAVYPYMGTSGHDSFRDGSPWDDSSSNNDSFRTLSSLGSPLSDTFQSVGRTASNLARPSGGGGGGGGGGSSSGGGGGGGSGGGGGVR